MQIIFKDQYLIAINKPAGLLVHRSKIDKYETQFAMQMLRDFIGQHVYPVHRLDKPTSGVLLFALDKETAARMMLMFSNGCVEKNYLAVCRGYVEESGLIDYALVEQLDKMTDEKADQNKIAQQAITLYQRLATVELPIAVGRYSTSRYSLVLVQPQTGRKHQIRRHLKHIFHPIVGDTTHGDGKHNSLFREHLHCHRLLLHCYQTSFNHPVTSQTIFVNASPDDEFKKILDSFGWQKNLPVGIIQ